jgi:hypothetical protein
MVAIGGGWIALRLTGSLNWLFAALASGLIVSMALCSPPRSNQAHGSIESDSPLATWQLDSRESKSDEVYLRALKFLSGIQFRSRLDSRSKHGGMWDFGKLIEFSAPALVSVARQKF